MTEFRNSVNLIQISQDNEKINYHLTGKSINSTYQREVDPILIELIQSLYHKTGIPDFCEDYLTEVEDRYMQCHPRGFPASQTSAFLRSLGEYFSSKILPSELVYHLSKLPVSSYLFLDIDDHLAALPWELIYDGAAFWGLKFICGRRTQTAKTDLERSSDKIKLMIISNPTGDLNAADSEANYIIEQLRGDHRLQISRFGSEIVKKRFLDLFSSGQYQIIHFSGHSSTNPFDPSRSQLTFKDGPCYAYEIEQCHQLQSPRLVFANSCQSAGVAGSLNNTGLTSLAGSFLKAGTEGCVAALWPVTDIGSAQLATDFYRSLMYGKTIGESMHSAKINSFKRWNYNDLVWASYILYGDPIMRLF